VLQININEMDDDAGAYANKYLLFAVDPAEHGGRKCSPYRGAVRKERERRIAEE
jgi:hypothetical protein